MNTIEQLKSLKASIINKDDIKSFEIKEIFPGKIIKCAVVSINGIDVEFMYYSNLTFLLSYKRDSEMFEYFKSELNKMIDIKIIVLLLLESGTSIQSLIFFENFKNLLTSKQI